MQEEGRCQCVLQKWPQGGISFYPEAAITPSESILGSAASIEIGGGDIHGYRN
ncbi:protein of unknown function [Stenotrophomonas maltophilia]|nr:protein of unknown function [Stenotrophomonas maltophilia]